MPFGNSLNQKATPTKKGNNPTVFLDLHEGAREIRILGDEIQVKELWLYCNVNGKKEKRPFFVAVLKNDQFVGYENEDWYNAPLNRWVQSQDETTQKDLYAKSRFLINIWDRTPVIRKDDKIFYPGKKGAYKTGNDGMYEVDGNPEPHNTVLVMVQSAGKKGGKHFLQQIVDLQEMLVDPKTGKECDIHDIDIRIVTRVTKEDNGRDVTRRNVYAGFNQDVTKPDKLYDLVEYCKPWPIEAQKKILDGADYNEIRKEYNIISFPVLKGNELF